MLLRGGGTFGGAGSGDGGRLGTAGRAGLLGFAGRGFAASGFGGAALCGFSTLGGRGFSGRGEWGMLPSLPASDRGAGAPPVLSDRDGFRTHHHPRNFHHEIPMVL